MSSKDYSEISETQTNSKTSNTPKQESYADLPIGAKALEPIYYTEAELALIRKSKERMLRNVGQLK